MESYAWGNIICNIWPPPPPPHIQLKQSVPKTTKEKPESNEYNWSTEY